MPVQPAYWCTRYLCIQKSPFEIFYNFQISRAFRPIIPSAAYRILFSISGKRKRIEKVVLMIHRRSLVCEHRNRNQNPRSQKRLRAPTRQNPTRWIQWRQLFLLSTGRYGTGYQNCSYFVDIKCCLKMCVPYRWRPFVGQIGSMRKEISGESEFSG